MYDYVWRCMTLCDYVWQEWWCMTMYNKVWLWMANFHYLKLYEDIKRYFDLLNKSWLCIKLRNSCSIRALSRQNLSWQNVFFWQLSWYDLVLTLIGYQAQGRLRLPLKVGNTWHPKLRLLRKLIKLDTQISLSRSIFGSLWRCMKIQEGPWALV